MASDKKSTHALKVHRLLIKAYPQAICALAHRNAFELLAATILSAQCTDRRVNLVTPALFKAFPTPDAMAHASIEQLEALVKTTGFFRSKSKNLKAMAARLCSHYAGEVPRTLKDLITLPGVARKTANVVLGVCFGLSEGVVVDTHVSRISQRLGLTSRSTASDIEKDLMQALPKNAWIAFSHRVIEHGRQVCDARRPKCPQCPLRQLCPSRSLTT